MAMSKLQSGGRDAGGRGKKGGQRGSNMFRVSNVESKSTNVTVLV